MVLRENLMTLPIDKNIAAAAARRSFPYSMATANVQYHYNEAEMNATNGERSPSLFSETNPIQQQLSANHVCYNNQAPPQSFPVAYPSTFHWQERQFTNVDDHARAFALMPASARVTRIPTMASINNNVASLMPNNGNPDPDDTINIEQLLVDFKILHPGPRNPFIPVASALTAPPIPTRVHNHIMQTQSQQFQPHTHALTSENNAANNGVILMSKRRRISSPEEDMDRKMRQMIKNRASAARSRARKLAREIELQSEVSKLRKENENLKNMMEVIAETKDSDTKLRRTKSWV